ncbi:MAG: ORF6N domain-containing protein [bacterium]
MRVNIMKPTKTKQISKELINMDDIKNRIFTLRGLQVMLDKDLAVLYGVKPIRLREQVKRNMKRFPKDFMFQLTVEEIGFMLSQNAIPFIIMEHRLKMQARSGLPFPKWT